MDSVKTYTVKSFDNIVEIGTTLGKNWFRGHSRIYESLIPGIFRDKYNSPIHQLFKPQHEFKLIANFKRYAPSIQPNMPDPDDHLNWLLWMQHFGIPTRLLDWTESMLVALFFTVVEFPKYDGEIWTIYPDFLNEKSEFVGISLQNDRQVRYLASEPNHNKPIVLVKELNLEEKPRYPIAFYPPLIFPRLGAQMCTYTIHPKPVDNNKIENIINDEKNITRYIIPSKLKSEFEKKLSYLEISYRTLFPDLEGLSKSFAREERYYGWGQPQPPNFKS